MLQFYIIMIGSIWGLAILVGILKKVCDLRKDPAAEIRKNDAKMEQGFKDKYQHVGDKPLGAGACGATWKVKEKGGDDNVFYACKEAHREDDLICMFKAEQDTLSKCDHPHICKYVDGFGEGKVGSCIILQLLEGKNIQDHIKDKGYDDNVPKDIALDWMIQMASAVHYLHTEVGIVHRDLHNGNWMVTDDSKHITMIDFGTAVQCGVGKLLPTTFCFHGFQSP